MAVSVLQWNIRGYLANQTSLDRLIKNTTPNVFCLQETKFPHANYCYNGYKPYHHINNKNKIASGGSSVYVKNNRRQFSLCKK